MRSDCLIRSNIKLPFDKLIFDSTYDQDQTGFDYCKSRNINKAKHVMTILDQTTNLDDDSDQLCFDGFGNIITNEGFESDDTDNNENIGESIGDSVIVDDLSQDTCADKLNDLSWLYNHERSTKFSLFTEGPGLSQLDTSTEDPVVSYTDVYPDEERLEIEAEIKRKFVELEELMDRIQAVKQRKRRKRYSRKRHGTRLEGLGGAGYVNIIPIQRDRRLASPLRNALLIRSAMKRAWKGSLGSCCVHDCWARWKWVNLRHVMADYE